MSDNRKRRLILLATCLAVFLVALDVTIINLALPSIQRDLEVTLVERSWVLKAYTLTFAVLVIVGGKLGDIFGRKRFLVAGAALFAVGSLIGFLSFDIRMLMAARVVQAIGSAMMMPGSLSVLTDAYQNRNMATAIGLWGSIGALGFIAGPLIGGAFTSLLAWRAIFLLNIPVILVALAIIMLTVRESRDESIDRRIDYLGVVLIALSVLMLALAIVGGNEDGWTSSSTLLFFALAGVSILALVVTELRVEYPIVDPRFFRNRAFSVGILVRFATGFAFVPVIFMSTVYMQDFLRKSALESGLLFLPAGAAIVAATLFWGRVSDKYSLRWPMVLGMLITSVAAFLWLTFDANSDYGILLLSLLLASIGGAAAFVTTTTVLVNFLGVNKAGVASGIVYMTQNVSATLGIALVSSVFLSSLRAELATRDPAADYEMVQSLGPAVGSVPQAEAFAVALSYAGLVVAIVLLLGAAAAFFLPRDFNVSPQKADAGKAS